MVKTSPTNVEVVVENGNESLILMCDIVNGPGGPGALRWTKDGTSINSSTRHIMETSNSGSSLQIRNLSKSDEGDYHCIYEISGVVFSSNQTTVSIIGTYIYILV